MPNKELNRMWMNLWRMSGVLLVCGIASCTNSHEHGSHEGEPSGATCPDESTLTYNNFGKAFMDNYCVSCHSSSLPSHERQGAPSDHNFDTLAEIQNTHLEHIDLVAAAGPNSTNTFMPPEDHVHDDSTTDNHPHHTAAMPYPSTTERFSLGEWLACGAP